MTVDKILTESRVKSWFAATTCRERVEHGNFPRLMFTHHGNRVRNPRQGIDVSKCNTELGKEMGPEGGYSNLAGIAKSIEPPSGEPQSPMLPLHHSGHGFRGQRSSLNEFGLLAYPYRNETESISLYSLDIKEEKTD